MNKKLRLAAVALLGLFALLQLANPARTNPPVTTDFVATLHPPAAVAADLKTACYDCHSSETTWPWYAHVAPVSWLIASDVNEGRGHLNLSDWPANDPKRAGRRVEEMSDQVSHHYMPPSQYTLIHAGARLTDAQRKTISDWLDAQADALSAPAH